MSKGIITLIGIVAMAGMTYYAYFGWATSKSPDNELDWLQTEFGLSDESLAQVETARASYLPQCLAMCERLAKARQELAGRTSSNVSKVSEVAEAYSEVNAIEEECVRMSLTHVFEVSMLIPEDQRNRYRNQMMEALTSDHSGPHQRHSNMIQGNTK